MAAIRNILITLLSFSSLHHGEAKTDFSHDIVPILRKHCADCHLGEKRKGGFSMNTRADLLSGGESGKAVSPGAAKSLLLDLLTTKDEDDRMPPKGPGLSPAEIDRIRSWIAEGLSWESGFAFDKPAYEPPLKPRQPKLPPAMSGRTNTIDRIIDSYLSQRQIPLPGEISDAAFARRLHLDLVGLLPEPEALESFLATPAATRRSELINRVLADDVAYAEHWLTFWNDLLRNDYSGTGFITGGRKQITDWLYRALVNNKPFNEFVRELIAPTPASEGFINGIKWRGNVNASQTLEVQFAQNVSQVFLGINLKCASCHDSFIDRWKLEEAYQLAAVYSTNKVEINRCDKPIGKFAEPGWLFPELGDVDANAPQPLRLKQLASLMTHPENGRLTRTIVNRLWHRLMGRGIVHPVDAMQMEPWSADLLDHLASHLSDHNYDIKQTLALIVSSRAYQSRALPMPAEPDARAYTFSGPLTRRMSAEQFLDAVWQITEAGPSVPDVSVFRGRTEDQADAKANLHGMWIWSYPEGSQSIPKAGETITLRRQLTLAERPELAAGVITADNEYTLFVNNQQIANDNFWPSVEVVPLEAALKQGTNEILLVVANAGDKPNAAAVFFEARLKFADGTEQVIATDETWEWTPSVPQVKRETASFKKTPSDWKPAAAVENQSFLPGKVRREISSKISQIYAAKNHFVRASLVKLDFLARSLGRPFRDQVVSTRPENLTTLQAIDLQNGEILNEILVRAAKNVAARDLDADALVEWLYLSAISRPPTDAERKVARAILKDSPGNQGIEDLLWILFMLPEFQLIR